MEEVGCAALQPGRAYRHCAVALYYVLVCYTVCAVWCCAVHSATPAQVHLQPDTP